MILNRSKLSLNTGEAWPGPGVPSSIPCQVTAISLTEMLFGRLDVVEDLRLSFPITGFFFYLVFMVPRPCFFSWALATLPGQKICFTEKQLSVESKSKSSAWIQEIFVIFSA